MYEILPIVCPSCCPLIKLRRGILCAINVILVEFFICIHWNSNRAKIKRRKRLRANESRSNSIWTLRNGTWCQLSFVQKFMSEDVTNDFKLTTLLPANCGYNISLEFAHWFLFLRCGLAPSSLWYWVAYHLNWDSMCLLFHFSNVMIIHSDSFFPLHIQISNVVLPILQS